jgi:hypothetical protein
VHLPAHDVEHALARDLFAVREVHVAQCLHCTETAQFAIGQRVTLAQVERLAQHGQYLGRGVSAQCGGAPTVRLCCACTNLARPVAVKWWHLDRSIVVSCVQRRETSVEEVLVSLCGSADVRDTY